MNTGITAYQIIVSIMFGINLVCYLCCWIMIRYLNARIREYDYLKEYEKTVFTQNEAVKYDGLN